MGNKKRNGFTFGRTKAKLTFHEGFKEEPTHRIVGQVTEKDKGISMLELIQCKFNISYEEFKDVFKRKLSEWQKDAFTPTEYKEVYPRRFSLKDEKPQFTKDEKGRIISPFSNKAKELKEND